MVSTQTTSSTTPLFITPIEYKITYTGGDTTLRLMHSQKQMVHKIAINKTVSTIAIDPNNWIINRGTAAKDPTIVGLNEQLNNQTIMQVFPNPASQQIQINGVNPSSNVLVFDALGRVQISTTLKNNHLDISSLNAGLYWVEVKDELTQNCIQFIKQ